MPHQGARPEDSSVGISAKDIERFDPSNPESSIDDYLWEVEHCLLDLPNPSAREKLKLVWKTTPRSVHVFMETLPPATRDCFSSLCQALREDYSLYDDPASATLGALSIIQKKLEPPREYYRRLRVAYFQGRNAPGLEEDHTFKSLSVNNLHESIRFDVALFCRSADHNMQEIRKYVQMVWELHSCQNKKPDHDSVLAIQTTQDADLALKGSELPRAKAVAQVRPRECPPLHQWNRLQNQEGEEEKRSKWQYFHRPKGGGDDHAKKGGEYNCKEEYLTSEMRDWIQACLTEAIQNLDLPKSPRGHTPTHSHY